VVQGVLEAQLVPWDLEALPDQFVPLCHSVLGHLEHPGGGTATIWVLFVKLAQFPALVGYDVTFSAFKREQERKTYAAKGDVQKVR